MWRFQSECVSVVGDKEWVYVSMIVDVGIVRHGTCFLVRMRLPPCLVARNIPVISLDLVVVDTGLIV
jgi:hypothetical protein